MNAGEEPASGTREARLAVGDWLLIALLQPCFLPPCDLGLSRPCSGPPFLVQNVEVPLSLPVLAQGRTHSGDSVAIASSRAKLLPEIWGF